MSKLNYDFSITLNKLVLELESFKDKKIALYGYGTMGKIAYSILKQSISVVIDQNAKFMPHDELMCDLILPSELHQYSYDIILVAILGREDEIIRYLIEKNGVSRSIIQEFHFLEKDQNSTDHSPENIQKWQLLKNKYYGKRCFIIGNGPSLNKHDLSSLQNEYTFGVNGIFYKTEEMGFKPTFYVVEDNHVIDDNLEKINEYECLYKFFPLEHKKKIKTTKNILYFDYECGFYNQNSPFYSKPRFSFDCSEYTYAGQTVTYTNLQIAYFLGFKEVYLIGMDFTYSVPTSTHIQGNTYISKEDDVNHFHPSYFGKGKKWHDPKLDRVALNFELANKVYNESGRKIYNLSIGGELNIFERKDWFSVVGKNN